MNTVFKQIENSTNDTLDSQDKSTNHIAKAIDINQYDWVSNDEIMKSDRTSANSIVISQDTNLERKGDNHNNDPEIQFINSNYYRKRVNESGASMAPVFIEIPNSNSDQSKGISAITFANIFKNNNKTCVSAAREIKDVFLASLDLSDESEYVYKIAERLSIFVAAVELASKVANTGFYEGQAILAGQKWFKSWQHSQLITNEHNTEAQQEQGE